MRDAVVAIAAAAALITRALSLLEVVAISGVVGALMFKPPSARGGERAGDDAVFFALAPAAAKAVTAATGLALAGTLVVVFAKIGAATFGGGFAMVPPMADEALTRGWLSPSEIRDAVALGQMTPGPVAICATFIGYRVGGLGGALAATLGIFVPPFVVALVAARSLRAFRTNPVLRGFLRAISAAVVGIITAAAVALFRVSVHGPFEIALAAGALAFRLALPRTAPVWPLVAAGVVALGGRVLFGSG